MLIITIIYALISVLGISSIIYPVLVKCDVLAKPSRGAENQENTRHELAEQVGEKKKCCQSCKNFVYFFNEKYFAPFFSRSSSKGSLNKGQYGDMDEEGTTEGDGDHNMQSESNWSVNDTMHDEENDKN